MCYLIRNLSKGCIVFILSICTDVWECVKFLLHFTIILQLLNVYFSPCNVPFNRIQDIVHHFNICCFRQMHVRTNVGWACGSLDDRSNSWFLVLASGHTDDIVIWCKVSQQELWYCVQTESWIMREAGIEPKITVMMMMIIIMTWVKIPSELGVIFVKQ